MPQNVLTELRARGQFDNVTDEALGERLAKESLSVYVGFDPTAVSLHVGSMLPILGLMRFQRAGHRPIAVAGGGTGMIGDPSGKRTERTMMTEETVHRNTEAIGRQLSKFLDFTGPNAALLVNNHDWLKDISFIEMLRDTGKHFRIGEMLGKESVRARLNSEDGISFTEFSYMLLQSYDFLHLYRTHNCIIQGGGSDQWGNITAGMELIRRVTGGQAYGVTFPLLMTSAGTKYGKSEGGAVWLDPTMTSPYDFYQFFVRAEDADVERLLKFFTLLPIEEIDAIVAEHRKAPEKREAQRTLAREVTKMVHGEEEVKKAESASTALFGGSLTTLDEAQLRAMFADVTSVSVPRAELEAGLTAMKLFVRAGLADSNKEAKRLFEQGGLYINNEQLKDAQRAMTAADLLAGGTVVLRAGKKSYALVRFE